jgi:hypothetical protein
MRAGAIEGRERKNDWHARAKSDFEVAALIHQPATRTGQTCAVIDRRRATATARQLRSANSPAAG